MTIIYAVLLSILGPGMGQLYNREFKKGIFLIVLSTFLFIAFSGWLARAAMPYYMPMGGEMPDMAALAAIGKDIEARVTKDYPHTLDIYELMITGLWIYGIVDAYLGALRRRKIPEPQS